MSDATAAVTTPELHTCRILVVDDERQNLLVMEKFLATAGLTNVITAQDPRTVVSLYQEHRPDLVILDLMMPYLDGVAVMERIAQVTPRDDYVPVLVVTADASRQARVRALASGASDFLTKPLEMAEVQLRVRNLLTTRMLYRHLAAQRAQLQERLTERAEALSAVRGSGEEIIASLDEREIGRRLLAAASQAPGFAGASLYLRDAEGRLQKRETAGDSAPLQALREIPGILASRRSAAVHGHAQTFFVPDPEGGSALAGWYLPLRGHGRLLGVLEVVGGLAITQESSADMLASLCAQAATALENARLYQEVAHRERQLKELVGRLIAAQEEERRRVALEIHDGLAQGVAAVHQHVQGYIARHPPRSAESCAEMQRLAEMAQRVAGEARRVIAGLRPAALDRAGLAEALREEVDAMAGDGWDVEFEEGLGDRRLPPEVEIALFRVAQEALTNVRRHAGASRVAVRLERQRGGVRLEVRDWGRGFNPAAPAGQARGEHVGLSSMRERLEMIGGELAIQSRRHEGTSVLATVPARALRRPTSAA